MLEPGYQLRYKKSIDRDLRQLPDSHRQTIVAKILQLAREPRPASSTKLQGSRDLYRIRHADYRIIYQINDGQLIILVVKVGHRREVYRPY
ncbi:MAG TPA: type II toxin-antitoxin system RelE/ParE family toxin [Candidatus Saccharimonadia bacterium]|nr:type II toxin-antitoxin system RelE/ParE family toxin [Candidatus Saccharimonadia bacterium]